MADLDVRTTSLNRFGPLRRHHRYALPFLARAVSRQVIDADVVLASSTGWAHGFPTSGSKVVYCHAPARWLYQRDRYLGAGRRGESVAQRASRWVATGMLGVASGPLRRWDEQAARTADVYLAKLHGHAEGGPGRLRDRRRGRRAAAGAPADRGRVAS